MARSPGERCGRHEDKVRREPGGQRGGHDWRLRKMLPGNADGLVLVFGVYGDSEHVQGPIQGPDDVIRARSVLLYRGEE